MPEFTSYPAGTPSWVDHAAKDVAASNSFYSGLFGWEAEDQGDEMGNYTILRKGGKTVAGNMTVMMEGQPSAWVSYVSVDDAEATTDLAKKAGAAVFVEPMDVSDIGRMAVFADPSGAAIGVWQPKTFKGAELANEPGSFAWNELNTRDVPAAKAFYTKVFGWKANDMDWAE
jgi:predicted enzyme related to lactoylglutathione lyase